jgi:hypothetical protein
MVDWSCGLCFILIFLARCTQDEDGVENPLSGSTYLFSGVIVNGIEHEVDGIQGRKPPPPAPGLLSDKGVLGAQVLELIDGIIAKLPQSLISCFGILRTNQVFNSFNQSGTATHVIPP